MFIALDIRQRESGGLVGGLRSLFTRPGVYLEQRSCAGARFSVLKAESGKKGVSWDMVESACGYHSDRILIPGGVSVPEGCRIKSPGLKSFRKAVMVKTACGIISRSRLPMYLRVLGIIDNEGIMDDSLRALLMHFTSVRVVTGRRELYLAAARRMMEELGAPVTVCGSVSALSGCALILSASSEGERYGERFCCPVIADGPFEAPGTDIITSLRTYPDARILDACPDGVDPHLFAGALYEFCGMDKAAQAADSMYFNYRAAELSEAVKSVVKAAGFEGKTM